MPQGAKYKMHAVRNKILAESAAADVLFKNFILLEFCVAKLIKNLVLLII
jgi:hypothetical protein